MRHYATAAVLAALLAAGCNLQSEGDVEAIATDAANDATRGRFSELEARIDELETEVRSLKDRDEKLFEYSQAISRVDKANADALEDEVKEIRRAYTAHLREHGVVAGIAAH